MSKIYIPIKLRRALDAFDIDVMLSLVSQFGQNNSRPIPSLLYHYTDGLGLRGILESGSLWFTDIFSLNDPTELRHGIDAFLATMRGHLLSGKPDLHKFIDALEEMLSDDTKNIVHHFVCSFSQTGDDLGQWRAYADNGRGYALAFEGQLLLDSWSKKMTPKGLRLAFPVIYDQKLLDDVTTQITKKLHEALELAQKTKVKADAVRLYEERIISKLATRVALLSLLFKHAAYKNENEFRLLDILYLNSLTNLKYRNRPYALIRYLEWSWRAIAPAALKKILVGPSADQNIARQFAKDCLRAFHADNEIEIIISDIPYRVP